MASYDTIGGYTSGVWLVSQNGKGAIVDRAHLPSGKGYQYYWLGANIHQAEARINAAVNKLGIVTDNPPVTDPSTGHNKYLDQAFKTGVANLNFDQLQPFHIGKPSPTSGYAKGVSNAGGAATQTVTAAAGAVGSAFGVFATMGFWKGIGLIVAGAAIIIFAAIEFKQMAV